MENTPTVIRPPPPPSFPQPDNSTITIGSPPPLPFSTQPPQVYPIDQNGAFPMTINQAPPFPDSPRSIDLSPLEFILALMAVITIPAVIYAFFFAVKCPPWTSRESPPDSPPRASHGGGGGGAQVTEREGEAVVSGVKYQRETHSKDIGNECPVCLSVFADGEEVRQLSGCKHSFHAYCINLWLENHNNCPICRASIAVKRPPNNNRPPPRSARDHTDLHQGLPDAASLV